MIEWSAEKIAALELEGLKSLRANALKIGHREVIALCDAELAKRKPPKSPKKSASLPRADHCVAGRA
jgi:hypothetical protein